MARPGHAPIFERLKHHHNCPRSPTTSQFASGERGIGRTGISPNSRELSSAHLRVSWLDEGFRLQRKTLTKPSAKHEKASPGNTSNLRRPPRVKRSRNPVPQSHPPSSFTQPFLPNQGLPRTPPAMQSPGKAPQSLPCIAERWPGAHQSPHQRSSA